MMRSSPLPFLLLLLAIPPTTAQLASDVLLAGCDPTLPPNQQCGGHGSCANITQTCTCESGWSKNSDFVEVESCETNDVGMYVLWTINAIENIWVLWHVSWVIVARIENFMEVRRTQRGYTLAQNKGLLGVLLFFTFCTPAHVIMIISKWADPFTRIGFDPLPTAMFLIGKAGLYLAALFLQGPLLSATLKHEPRFKRTVAINYLTNTIICMCSIIVGGFPIITLMYFTENKQVQFQIMWAYYAGQSLTLAAQATTAFLVFRHVKNVLSKAQGLVSGDKSAQIIKRAGAVQNQIIRQASVQCVLLIIMASVPFLMNKHQWWLPLSWLAMPPIGKALAMQVDLDLIKPKTLMQRLGLSSSTAGSRNAEGKQTVGGGGGSAGDTFSSKLGSSFMRNFNPSFAPTSAVANESVVLAHGKEKNTGKEQQTLVSHVMSDTAMEEILSPESDVRAKFTKFVREKFASEALMLYDACVEYEKLAPTATPDERTRLARKIISSYVVDNAPKAVDMGHEMRVQLLAKSKAGDFDADSLKGLKNMAFMLLKDNFYNQFRESS